ncbi:hypothetical protein ACS0TY_005382 [Phlomoides rotata]
MGASSCRRRSKRKKKNEEEEEWVQSDCSTPKAERYRIPEIKTCPPAPKKKRRIIHPPRYNSNVRTSQIPFFLPPDIDLFFYFALRGISVQAAL